VTLAIALLVFVSAALHPWREYFLKGDATPEGTILAVMLSFAVLSAVLVPIQGIDPLSALPVWPLALLSGASTCAFYICVINAMRHGDLSIYYPITRSSPLFVVIVGFLFLGHRYSAMLLVGVAFVLVGAFLLQYRWRTRFFSQPRTLALATLAMCVHGVVTLADAEAMRTVSPVAYLLLEYTIIVPAIAVIFSFTRPPGRTVREHLFDGWIRTPGRVALAAATSYGSYYLILLAFQLGANVVAVSSVRQISIPLSVVMGGML
jgi:drug/metabolite transporter (DMT)-like permease